MPTYQHCDEYETVSRRAFLFGPFSELHRERINLPTWVPEFRFADPHVGPRGDTLVCIFLRGGADGLSVLVPHGDENYYNLRPTINVPRPDDNRADVRAVDLDGFFGFHPSLGPLKELFDADALACVHATGSPDDSRSHFKAMAAMERASFGGGAYSGWLARHLATFDSGNESAVRAVAVGEMVPTALSGSPATALRSIADYSLNASAEVSDLLEMLYDDGDDPLAKAARQTFNTLESLNLNSAGPRVPNGRPYPETEFGMALSTVAELIENDAGVEVACIDVGGWDTHAGQGVKEGYMANLLTEVGEGLAAFYEDMQAHMGNVTVVVMSEFGRRARENGAFGTDHGFGNMMLLLGDGLNGGQVYADWPGLAQEQLTGPGDLTITTDYRDVLGELTVNRLNNPLLDEVFPGYTVNALGLAQPRTNLSV